MYWKKVHGTGPADGAGKASSPKGSLSVRNAMNPYSHLIVASKLKKIVAPENSPEYYWGAVAPDMRYPAGLERKQTHLAPARIQACAARYPELKSFLQGYLVHCLADEIELAKVFHPHFPFSLLKGRFGPKQLSVLLELYFLEKETLSNEPSGSYNGFLQELGLSRAHAEKFHAALIRYIDSKSPARSNLKELMKLLDLENDPRIKQYLTKARELQKSSLVKKGLFLGISAAGIDKKIVSWTARLYRDNVHG